MKKRVISFGLMLLFVLGMLPFGVLNAKAAPSSVLGPSYYVGKRDFKWPVPGYYNISSCFYDADAPEHNPETGTGRTWHYALDIATGGAETDVVAAYPGTVAEIVYNDGVNDGWYGNGVLIKHENVVLADGSTQTLYTRYAHMKDGSICVSQGQSVSAGQKIGTTGGTGHGGTPYAVHLDFQILTTSNWRVRENCSIDPYSNYFLELPSGLYLGGTTNCCQNYINAVNALYATPSDLDTGSSRLKIEPSTAPSGNLTPGEIFSLRGTVSSNYKITRFEGSIIKASGIEQQTIVTFPNAYTVDIRSSNVNQLLDFSSYPIGKYKLHYYATDSSSNAVSWDSDWFWIGDTVVENFELDVNGQLDGAASSNLSNYGTFDVYINGNAVGNDVSDYDTSWPSGSSYEINDIKPNPGYSYDGVYGGSRTGTISSDPTVVVLSFSRNDFTRITETPAEDTYNGHTYLYYSTPVTWYFAKEFCENQGGHLACVTSAAENSFVRGLINGSNAWIGLTDQGSGVWRWVTGEPFSYDDWADEEPNNSVSSSNDGEDFVHYNGTQWNDNMGNALCGFVCEIDSACEHEYSYAATTTPTKTETGVLTGTCSLCGDTVTITLPVLDAESYTFSVSQPTCTHRAIEHYRWNTTTYGEFTFDVELGTEYSDWSTTYPTGVDAAWIESRTEYRYSDYETAEIYESTYPGWNPTGSRLEATDSGTVNYVASWPSGFSTSHSLYSQYNNSPMSASETLSIDSTGTCGYIYWHWCRDNQEAYLESMNRLIKPQYSSEFHGFHAFFSTTSPAQLIASGARYDSSDNSIVFCNTDCCKDSEWYFSLEVKCQSYTTYTKLYTYERWTDWSEWSETAVTASDTRQVETRTVYRYITNPIVEHTWGEWTVVAEPTCTTDGERSRTCSTCGTVETEAIPAAHSWDENEQFCTVCGAQNPDYIALCVAPASVNVQKTGDVTVPVSISNNTGFAGFTFVITCAEGLTISNISKGALLSTSESGSFTKNVESGKVTWYDVENLTADDVLFNLTVTLAADAVPGEYAITIALKDEQPTNFVDYQSQAVPIRFAVGKVIYDDHTHNYTSQTILPTCTEAGTIIYTCECGDTYSEELQALGHLPSEATEEVTIAPGCTTAGSGYSVVSCERCGIELSREAIVLPALDHNYVETVLIPVTCTEGGASQLTCSRCGDSYTVVISPPGHTFEDEVLIPATCTEEGAILRTCTACGHQETTFTAPLGHDYAEEVLIAATCTGEGASQKTCTRCGDTKTEVTPALGHLLERTVTEPTCEEDGSIVETCSRCGYTHTEVLPALGHDYVGTILLEPTCTSRGVIRYTCSRCSKQYSEFIPAGHDLRYTDNGNGTHTANCSRCEYSTTEAHSFVDGVCVCGATELVPEIKSASLVLNEDIDIIYAVQVPNGFANPYLVVNGTEIRDYYERDGKLCFVYTGITPQCMGDSITAVLHAGRNSEDVTDTVANYSVKQYCLNQMNNHPDDAALKTLLSDLLIYGAAAQLYTNYKTDDLVTDGLTLTPSAYSALTGETVSFTGTADAATDWIGAGLILGNDVTMRLTFAVDSVADLTVNVNINGREEVFDAEDFSNAGSGKYYIDFSGIEATEFDDAVTASFSRGGKTIGRTVSYTVNAYVCSTQNSENTALQALVRALYNYGAAAVVYAAVSQD